MREPPVTRAERSALLAQAEGDPDGYDVERPLEQPLYRPILTTVCYCAVMGINGGLCGAFGPSLEMFERSTGLSQAALGASVMQNRLAKLGGTVFWGIYASSTSKRAATGDDPPLGVQPHTLKAIGLLLTALSTSVLGHTKSGFQLQAAMVLSGFMCVAARRARRACILLQYSLYCRAHRSPAPSGSHRSPALSGSQVRCD